MVVGPIVARILAQRGATAASARLSAIAGARIGLAEAEAALQLLEQEETIVVPVDSSAIQAIGFSPSEEQIIVVFNRGGAYKYPGDIGLFTEFMLASSKGQFFNQRIKPSG